MSVYQEGTRFVHADGSKFDVRLLGKLEEMEGEDQYSGVGFPEGKVEAPVGATYVDTAATAGAIRWIKTSGAGATGWRVEWGDTEWRKIPYDEGSTGDLFVRRIGEKVTYQFVDFTPPAGSFAVDIATTIVGFRTTIPVFTWLFSSGWNGEPQIVGTYRQHKISWLRNGSFTSARPTHATSGDLTFVSTDSWPSSLPGTPR